MVKITDLDIDPLKKEYKCTVFADSKSDITTLEQLEHDLRLPTGAHVAWGSKIITANADLAFIKSDGTINWATD